MANEPVTSYEVDMAQNVAKDVARREPPASNPKKRLIELKSPNETLEETSRDDIFSSDSHAGQAIDREKLQSPENSNSSSSESHMAILTTETDLYTGGLGSGGDDGGGGESIQMSSTDQKCNSLVESRYRPQKYCAVCGDKAIACNFNAVTCESCKAFFRRNAFKEQRLKCLFENRCIIDRVTRRFCSKCRLLKCLSIGMKREWILTDEQKQIKRAKIMQNKQNRQQQVTTSSPDQTTTSSGRTAQWKPKRYSDCDSSLSSIASNSPSTSAATTYAVQPNSSQCQQTTVSDICASSAIETSKMTAGPLHVTPTIASTRDAATCCPDTSDFVAGTMGHYCTLAHQCQFCAIKLQHEQQAICNAMCSSQQQKPIQFLSDYDHGLQVPVYDSIQRGSQMHGQFIYSNTSSNTNHQQQQAPGTMIGLPMLMSTNNYNHNSLPHTSLHQVKFGASAPAAASCCCPPDASSGQVYPPPIIPEQPAISQSRAQTTGLESHPQQRMQQDTPKPQLHILKPAINKNQPRPSNIVDLLKRASTAVNLTRPGAIDETSDSQGALSDSHPFEEATGLASYPSVRVDSAEQKELTCLIGAKQELGDINLSEQASAKEFLKYNGEQTVLNQRVDCQEKATTISKSNDRNGDSGTDAGATSQLKGVAPTTFDRSKLGCSMWEDESYFEPASSEEEASDRIRRLNFNDTERQLMFEMMEATRYIFDNHNDRTSPPANLDEIVLFCDFSLRRLIKSVKQIGAFRILSMDDQILLLKTACFKVLLLRSAYHYEDEFDGFYDKQSGHRMKMDILKGAKKSLVYEKHMELLQKIALPLRRDRIILSILAMALLFDPNVNLKHTSSVELDNLIYLSILRKYLVSLQPDPLAKYKRLVEALQVLNACNEEYNVFFSKDFQPEQVTPLLIEIFDIPINSGSV